MKDILIIKRLSKARKIGNLMSRLPFVKCVILNGSLAQGKSKESSDIDILIIAKSGRIFTARFLVNLLASILRIKRLKNDSKSHAGKFCFNYFLIEDYLKIPTGRGEKIDKYCAENYSASKFIAGDRELYNEFIKTNKELFIKYDRHSCDLLSSSDLIRGSRERVTGFQIKSGMTATPPTLSLNKGKKVGVLNNWLEQKLKSYQIKRIESDPRTKKYPDLIVYNDKELRFHPPKS